MALYLIATRQAALTAEGLSPSTRRHVWQLQAAWQHPGAHAACALSAVDEVP